MNDETFFYLGRKGVMLMLSDKKRPPAQTFLPNSLNPLQGNFFK